MNENKGLKQGFKKLIVVGETKVNDKTFNLQQTSTKNLDYIYNSMGLYVKVGNEDTKVSMFGGIQDKIYVHGVKQKDGKTIEDWDDKFAIDWADRNNIDIKQKVGSSCFIRIKIQKDESGKLIEKTFLTEYDAIEYLSEHLKDGMRVYIGGKLGLNPKVNEETFINKNVGTIYLQETSNDKYKPYARCKLTYLITKESIDSVKISEVKNNISKGSKDNVLIPVKGYVASYVGKVDGQEIKKVLAVPLTININATKTTLFEKMISLWFRPQKDNVIALDLECNFITEGSLVEVESLDLSEDIKMAIEMGMFSKDDIAYKAVGNNNRTFEYLEFLRPETIIDATGGMNVKINHEAYKLNDLLFLESFLSKNNNTDANEKEEIKKDVEKATQKSDLSTMTDEVLTNFADMDDDEIDEFFA